MLQFLLFGRLLCFDSHGLGLRSPHRSLAFCPLIFFSLKRVRHASQNTVQPSKPQAKQAWQASWFLVTFSQPADNQHQHSSILPEQYGWHHSYQQKNQGRILSVICATCIYFEHCHLWWFYLCLCLILIANPQPIAIVDDCD